MPPKKKAPDSNSGGEYKREKVMPKIFKGTGDFEQLRKKFWEEADRSYRPLFYKIMEQINFVDDLLLSKQVSMNLLTEVGSEILEQIKIIDQIQSEFRLSKRIVVGLLYRDPLSGFIRMVPAMVTSSAVSPHLFDQTFNIQAAGADWPVCFDPRGIPGPSRHLSSPKNSENPHSSLANSGNFFLRFLGISKIR